MHVWDQLREKGLWSGFETPNLRSESVLYLELKRTIFVEEKVLCFKKKEGEEGCPPLSCTTVLASGGYPWALWREPEVWKQFWVFQAPRWLASCEVTAFLLSFCRKKLKGKALVRDRRKQRRSSRWEGREMGYDTPWREFPQWVLSPELPH